MAPQPRHSSLDLQARRPRLLAALIDRDGDRLMRQARRHSEFDQDAEDALADACVVFLRSYVGRPHQEDSLYWMLATVRRCALDVSKRRRRRERLHPTISIEAEAAFFPAPGPGPAEAAERSADVRRVSAAIGQLSTDQREALILFGLGYSYEEIAELRAWSLAKVHRCLSAGRARVRKLVAEGGNTP
jgi:RNA polymerase sigma factor (sigma-70 family)